MPPWAVTGRRCCCSTATPRPTSCGTASLPAGRAPHRRARRPAWVRRLLAAGLRRRPRVVLQAGDGRRPGRADARARLRGVRARRSRPRRPGRAPALPRPSRGGVAGGAAGHRADAARVHPRRPRPGDGVLPLVLPRAGPRSARAPDRCRPGVLPAPQDRAVVRRRRDRGVRAGGGRGVRPLLQRPRRDPGQLRGLPRRRLDRPRARRGRTPPPVGASSARRSCSGVPRASSAGPTTCSTCGGSTPPTYAVTPSAAATSSPRRSPPPPSPPSGIPRPRPPSGSHGPQRSSSG